MEETTAPPPVRRPGRSRGFQRFKSSEVIDAFRSARLELGTVRPMTREDYGFAPYVATEGTRFIIPSIGPESGGRVLSFSSSGDLETTKRYYDELGRGSAALFSWTFVNSNVLVQITGELPEAQARRYEAALRTLT